MHQQDVHRIQTMELLTCISFKTALSNCNCWLPYSSISPVKNVLQGEHEFTLVAIGTTRNFDYIARLLEMKHIRKVT
jgi:hypothetical protein